MLGPCTPRTGFPCRRGGRTNQAELMLRPNNQCSTSELPSQDTAGNRVPEIWLWTLHGTFDRERQMLLRKEVIQPHLPVRLPCYDFVLIASPTFDGSLHKG